MKCIFQTMICTAILIALAMPGQATAAVIVTISGDLTAVSTDGAGVDGASFSLEVVQPSGSVWVDDTSGFEIVTTLQPTRTLTLTGTPSGTNDGVYAGSSDYRFGSFGSGPQLGVVLSGDWLFTSDDYQVNSGPFLNMEILLGNGSVAPSAGEPVVVENFGGDNGTFIRSGLSNYTISNLSVQVVPEPTSFALLGLGLFPLTRRRRQTSIKEPVLSHAQMGYVEMHRLSLILACTLVLVLPASAARAEEEPDDPFVVEAVAQVNGGPDDVSDYFERNAVPTAALTPVTAQGSLPDFVSNASATFTQLKAFSSSDNDESGEAGADAEANDTLTIAAAGNPVGITRLEMTWQIDGTLSGSGSQVEFQSDYRTDAAVNENLDLLAGSFEFDTPGPVSQSVTFIYDGVPLGTPWNVRTQLDTLVIRGVGEADFDNTATFTGATLFVDNQPVSALITGASGQVYAVPEPASLALLGLGGLLVCRRRG